MKELKRIEFTNKEHAKEAKHYLTHTGWCYYMVNDAREVWVYEADNEEVDDLIQTLEKQGLEFTVSKNFKHDWL